jgi:hypothetical protein
MDQNELPLDPRHLEVPSGMPKTIFEPIACSAQTMHLFSVEINTFSKQNEASFHFTYVTWSSMGCDQKISMPVVYSAQTVHPSCAESNTVSEWMK